jgi:FtsH-binding integral membrane protein
MMTGQRNIWFFVGLLLLLYGVVILSIGLWEIAFPLAHPPVLSQLHAPIWWGALLAVLGGIFVARNRRRIQ